MVSIPIRKPAGFQISNSCLLQEFFKNSEGIVIGIIEEFQPEPKGQLISEWLVDVFKKPKKIFLYFCPTSGRVSLGQSIS